MLIKFKVKIELLILWLDSLLERLEQVLDVICGERRLAKDTHDFEDQPSDLEVVFNDGNEAVGDDAKMNLNAHWILRFSPEPLDLEMLFDPFEKLMRSFT